MPRYHFNVHDGQDSRDKDGIELTGLPEAQIQAIAYAGELLKSGAESISSGSDWHMEVTDSSSLVLFRIDVCLTKAAAAR